MERSEAQGNRPKILDEQPALYVHLELYWEGFNLLSRSRQSGVGPNPVAVSEALAVAAALDLPPFQFLKYVQEMDTVYLEFMRMKLENGA